MWASANKSHKCGLGMQSATSGFLSGMPVYHYRSRTHRRILQFEEIFFKLQAFFATIAS